MAEAMAASQKPSSETILEEKAKSSDVMKLQTDRPFLLKSFSHQVSGRASMLCYNCNTICKPYVSREFFFYHFLPSALKGFTPEFRGLMNVTFIENLCTGSVLTYAQPKSLLQPTSCDFASRVETPKPHSKRCVKDYGKTHVIYPSDFALSPAARAKSGQDLVRSTTSGFDDVVANLTDGFSSNMSLHNEAVNPESLSSGQSRGLENPWNSRVIDDTWAKLKSNNLVSHNSMRHTTTAKTKRFMLLENVTSPYRCPCVLDLKMGTRVRENASAAKLARHVTAIDLGARLSGMQVYNPSKKEFTYVNKYYGHNLSVEGFRSKLFEFFSRGKSPTLTKQSDVTAGDSSSDHPLNHIGSNIDESSFVDPKLVHVALSKLLTLRNAVVTLDSHRFYSCSLLLIYEGDTGSVAATSNHSRDVTGTNLSDAQTHPIQSSGDASTVAALKTRGNDVNKSSLKSRDVTLRDLPSNDQPPVAPSLLCDPGNQSVGHVTGRVQVEGSGDDKKSTKPASKRRLSTPVDESFGKCKIDLSNDNNSQFVKSETFSEDVEVRLIDFAHFCFQDPVVHPGPDGGFLFGLDNLISILQNTTSK